MNVNGISGSWRPPALALIGFNFLLAMVGGCSRETELPAIKEHSKSSETIQVPVRNVDAGGVNPELATMFVAAFGEPAPATVRAPTGGRESLLHYKAVAAIRTGVRVVLISEAETEDCHGCFGRLAIHYMAASKNGFVVSGSWPHFIVGNGWGKPPDWSIRRDLTSNPMIEVRTHFGNQGYDCDWVSLVELTSTGPIVRLPTTVTGYDNTGAVGERDGETTIGLVIPGPAGGIRIRYSGSRGGQTDYVLAEGKFERRGKQPLRECGTL